jgi:hypothetical protein
MADLPQEDRRTYWLRELTVPALMLVTIALFVADSLHLSTVALLLPAGLIIVVVGALAWALAEAALRHRGPHAEAAPIDTEDEAPGPILDLKAWALPVLPLVLFLLLDVIGAFLALTAVVFGAQMVFDRTRPARSLVIALAVTAPTYALFKYVLYVRFPAGLLGIG